MGNNGGIRKEKIPQILLWCCYYGFAMLYATWFAYYDIADVSGAVNAFYTSSHSCLLLTVMLCAFFFRKRDFLIAGKISSAILFILIILSAFFVELRGSIAAGIATGILCGVICFEVLRMLCYSMNRTERLVAIVASNAILCALGLVPAFLTRGSTAFYIVCAVMCALTAVAQFFVKKYEYYFDTEVVAEKNMDFRLRLTVILGLVGSVFSTGAVVLATNKLTYEAGYGYLYLFYVGGIASCIIFYLLNRNKRFIISLNANITFAATISSLGASLFYPSVAAEVLALLFGGAAFIYGMLCVYTGLSAVVQTSRSDKFFLIMLAVVGVLGGIIAPVSAGQLIVNGGNVFVYVAIIGASAILLTMLVFSPYLHKKIDADGEEIKVKEETPTEETVPPQNTVAEEEIMDKYMFSPREKEVAHLLVQGKTMRQISGEMGLSQSTINTYCTSIYRKCGINSRTELILLFK